jgi:hypothetical protein
VDDGGPQGRFLPCKDDTWQALEYGNDRHCFSPPQTLIEQDLRALRDAYRIPVQSLADRELVRTSLSALAATAQRGRATVE